MPDPEQPVAPPEEQKPAQVPPPPPAVTPPFITFIFASPGSAEFEARRHPQVSPMMLASVHAYLEVVLSKELSSVVAEGEKRREQEARKQFAKRPKFLGGGKLFGGN